MMLLLADGLDSLGGAGSGWVGAGLLGLVLSWLMLKHIPDKDRQAEMKDAKHAETVKEIVARHAETCATDANRCDQRSRDLRADYQKSLDNIAAPLSSAVHALGIAVERLDRKT